MDILTITIIMVTLIAIDIVISITAVIRTKKKEVSLKEEMVKFVIKKVSLKDLVGKKLFSKAVVDIYLDIMKNADKYVLSGTTLEIPNTKIQIWAANDVDSRRFYTHEDELKEEVDAKNKKLTYYDRVLLDRLITAIREGHNKMVTKFFIQD